jgi:hypothetical protein
MPDAASRVGRDVQHRTSVSWNTNFAPYYNIAKKMLMAMPPEAYDDFDWCIFDDYDVIGDVPIPFFTPYIYRAYGNGTKVINTVENASVWAASRASWDDRRKISDARRPWDGCSTRA